MRHTEPTSCRRERGKPTTPNPTLLPPGDAFPGFLPQTGAPSQTRLSLHHTGNPHPSALFQFEDKPWWLSWPTRGQQDQVRGKEIGQSSGEANPAEGWQRGRAQPLLQPRGTAPEWENKLQDKGKTTGGVVVGFETTGRGCCWPWGCAGLSTGGQSSGTQSRTLLLPLGPQINH